jgi:hypothetical protein
MPTISTGASMVGVFLFIGPVKIVRNLGQHASVTGPLHWTSVVCFLILIAELSVAQDTDAVGGTPSASNVRAGLCFKRLQKPPQSGRLQPSSRSMSCGCEVVARRSDIIMPRR